MLRMIAAMAVSLMVLAACEPQNPSIGADGRPVSKVYRIKRNDAGKIQFRMLDSINALRASSGAAPVTLNAALNAAAATHSRDMALQNRPWHFGSDASSPIDRVQRVGYTGRLLAENISESYETELETLAAWMEQADTRRTILAPNAADMGFAWHQEANGKLWWTLIMGDPNTNAAIPTANPQATRLVPVETVAVVSEGDETDVVVTE